MKKYLIAVIAGLCLGLAPMAASAQGVGVGLYIGPGVGVYSDPGYYYTPDPEYNYYYYPSGVNVNGGWGDYYGSSWHNGHGGWGHHHR